MANFKRMFVVIIMITSLTAALTAQQKRIVGYAPWWRIPEIKQCDFKDLTHINISFLRFLDGKFDFGRGPGNAAGFSGDDITAIVQKAHEAGAKVFISFGGYGGCDINKQKYAFPINDPKHREYIVNCLFEIVDTFNLDGIDMDFETEIYRFWGHYGAFTEMLRIGCDARNIGLSMAVHPWFTECIPNDAAVLNMYDFLNVMSYDYQGEGNNPGISNIDHSPIWLAYQLADYYHNVKGIAYDKLTLGTPFYGYEHGKSWDGAISWDWLVGTCGINNVRDANEYNFNERIMRYNSMQTVQKKAYAGGQEFGGICIWEIGQDHYGNTAFNLLRAAKNAMYSPVASTPRPTAAEKRFDKPFSIKPWDSPQNPITWKENDRKNVTRSKTHPDFPVVGKKGDRVDMSDYWVLFNAAGETKKVSPASAVTWVVRFNRVNVCTVDEKGVITAAGPGSAVVDAYKDGKRVASVNVTVKR